MHVMFTDEERKYMDMRKFGHVKIENDCPQKIKKSIEKKLGELDKFKKEQEKRMENA